MAGTAIERVRAAVARSLRAQRIESGTHVLVAVSGGQDSICLLDALAVIGLRLTVAHVDHRLRGAASVADAEFVRRVAGARRLPAMIRAADAAAYADEHRLGTEEAARIVRYHALGQMARSTRAAAIATGHTRDDLAETLLINMVRGTGTTGLRGIAPSQTLHQARLGVPPRELETPETDTPEVRLIRPLMDVSRAETEAYCRSAGLDFRVDRTNADTSILRNRVRYRLLPLLETYNPSIAASLARAARLAADDEQELARLAEEAWLRCARAESSSVEFDWQPWKSLGPGLQRRLLRRAARELGVPTAWSFDAVEEARALLTRRSAGRRLSLPRGLLLTTSRGGFRLAGGEPLGR